jgi:hypothetical protein
MPVMSSTDNTNVQLEPLRYRGWSISTQLIGGQLWLRWQHPNESFPRYSYPVTNRGLTDTIRFARSLIDLAIKLENESRQHHR